MSKKNSKNKVKTRQFHKNEAEQLQSTQISKLQKSFLILFLILFVATALRFFRLNENPPALYWDEASIAYNAFSIYQAGIDEHGISYPITHFLAFGDAKPPLYIYATTLSFYLTGVSEAAVRFPSALAGVLSVGITYFLGRKLFPKYSDALGLIAATLMAVSPWSIQMSRVGYEANLGLFFFLLGLTAFIYSNKRGWLLPVSAVSFVATWYTFNSYRIFLPLFLVSLLIVYWRQILQKKSWSLLSLVIAIALTAPLIPFVLSPQAKLRFEEVSIFKDLDPATQAQERIDLNNNALWSKLLHNRRILYGLHFLKHYSDHFKPDFLFLSGDVNPRLSVRDVGELYWIELPLLLIGIYYNSQEKNKVKWLLLLWMLLAIVPGGVARETPHALRILAVLPVPHLVIALGILKVSTQRRWLIPLIGVGYLLCFSFYLHVFFIQYPRHWSESWQYGYKQLVTEVAAISDNYERIYVTQSMGRPHTNFLWYLRYDPIKYLADQEVIIDGYGFVEVHRFNKYYFTNPPAKEANSGRWLMISMPDGVNENTKVVFTVRDIQGRPVFVGHEL